MFASATTGTKMSDSLVLVGLAHEQYRLAMGEYHRKRQSYLNALEFARDAGASYGAMARVVGSTRQKVYRLLNGGG